MKYAIPLAVGAGAGLAAYMGVIPGVGGKPDPAAIVKGATTPEALQAAQAQVVALNTQAWQRALGIAVAATVGAVVLGVGMKKR